MIAVENRPTHSQSGRRAFGLDRVRVGDVTIPIRGSAYDSSMFPIWDCSFISFFALQIIAAAAGLVLMLAIAWDSTSSPRASPVRNSSRCHHERSRPEPRLGGS